MCARNCAPETAPKSTRFVFARSNRLWAKLCCARVAPSFHVATRLSAGSFRGVEKLEARIVDLAPASSPPHGLHRIGLILVRTRLAPVHHISSTAD